MMRALVVVLLMGSIFSSYAQSDYSLYFVRHAEKQKNKDNPNLTSCGLTRAHQLSIILSKLDLKAVYSTTYKRTMSTARPTAKLFNIPIKNYSAKGLEQVARVLKQKKENALVVGHSNTTPQLVSLLANTKISGMTEAEYQRLYQLQFINDQVIVTELTQPLRCM